jgi:hypothetical protein
VICWVMKFEVARYSDDNNLENQKDISGRFVHTSELATYTSLLLALRSSNHGGKRGKKATLGQGETTCVTISRK